MAALKDVLSVSVPGLRALRWSSDELYVGMKETYTITRVEAGRSSFFARGKLWPSAPGSLRIQEPGDVVRDLRVFDLCSGSEAGTERETGE